MAVAAVAVAEAAVAKAAAVVLRPAEPPGQPTSANLPSGQAEQPVPAELVKSAVAVVAVAEAAVAKAAASTAAGHKRKRPVPLIIRGPDRVRRCLASGR